MVDAGDLVTGWHELVEGKVAPGEVVIEGRAAPRRGSWRAPASGAIVGVGSSVGLGSGDGRRSAGAVALGGASTRTRPLQAASASDDAIVTSERGSVAPADATRAGCTGRARPPEQPGVRCGPCPSSTPKTVAALARRR